MVSPERELVLPVHGRGSVLFGVTAGRLFCVFEGFDLRFVEVAKHARLRVRVGGEGEPVVLLHGHPRTHTTWHRVAPRLVQAGHAVVCPDLPGYGRSTCGPPRHDHAQASKREMAGAVRALMADLGHERFAVVGHDRGSYVAFRLAMDHPDVVARLVLIDCVPIAEALARADARFAQAWWHWFFYAQADKPERAISADPDAWYGAGPSLEARMGSENYADWRAAIHNPAVVTAMLEDYRAGLGADRAADEADRAAGRQLSCPTRLLWSARDDMEELYGDVLAVWRPWARDITGQSIDSGHHLAEEAPDALADAIAAFLRLP
jgi:haloacetate dehalogenase